MEGLVGEGGDCCGGGGFAGDAGGCFGGGGNAGSAQAAGGNVIDPGQQATAPESAADRATGGACEGGDSGVFPVSKRDVVAAPVGELEDFDADFQAAFLQRLVDRAEQGHAGGGFGCGAGEHAGDQLFDRHADSDLGGHPQSDHACPADAGPRGRQQRCHLDREDDHRADDDQLGVFDIGCAVTYLVGQLVDVFDQGLPGAFFARQFVPVGGDRVMGLSVDRRQRLLHRVRGVVIEFIQCSRHPRPRVGHPPHRGLVALGPITCTDHPFGRPLEPTRDFDAHQLSIWLI
uniref:hypothetical protein n=1 Tax=Nocardia pneumoniae TaxID=228601 RepID=UPI0012F69494|nr:hypothetical protein [Nocardia pneumoniae]